MAKQLGRALLVKIGDAASPEVFSNLCGLNSKSLTINNSSIDVTTPDCTSPEGALFTETLAGLKNVAVSGDVFFEDNSVNMQIVVPDFGTYAGAFRISSLEFGGETEGGVTYSLSLESSGAVTFTAA